MERVIEVSFGNERIVLSTMIQDPELRRRLSVEMNPDDFVEEKNQVVFRALSMMAKQGLEWSEDTVADLVRGENFGGFDYLRHLAEEYEPNDNIDYHVERLRLDALKVGLLRGEASSLCQILEDPTADIDRIKSAHRSVGARIENHRRGIRRESGGEGYFEDLRLRGLVGSVSEGFGFHILDSTLVVGLSPRAPLSIVAGRPGTGKSTLLANLIRYRVRTGRGIYVCGWEMDRNDYIDMMVSQETEIPAAVLVNGVKTLSDEQKKAITKAVELYTNPEFVVFDTDDFDDLPAPKSHWDINARNLDHFEGIVADASRTGMRLIAVDVVGKMLADRRPDALSTALARIRKIAKKYNVHIMLLHHLNRDSAQGRPTIEGLKGSGGFEEESDLIFALDRPMLRASPSRRRKMMDHLDIYLLKQRKGPAPLCVRFRFDGARYSLRDEVELDVAMLEQEDDD